MTISPYFLNLRSAYFAELDDMMSDSEGLHVLAKRLAERRKELSFLVHMLESAPEMVTVVFHKAFRFKSAAAMDHLLSHDADDLPEWDTLASTIELAPWAIDMVDIVREQPLGDWCLSVAAGLEYLYNKPETAQPLTRDSDDEDDEDLITDTDSLDDEEEKEARAREEAGQDWMVEQGFDRKD
jgi:hypothetical protein